MDKVTSRIKSLFSTKKRAAVTITAAVCAVLVFSAGAVFASVYWDMNEDRVEYAIAEKLAPDTVPMAQSDETAAPVTSANGGSMPALNEKKISQEKAESIALADAGFKKDQVTHLSSYYELDDGYHQYDVRFFNGQLEYEYAIDAGDGTILERDMDHIYD